MSSKEKNKRGGGKLKDTPILPLPDDAEQDVATEISQQPAIEIMKEISPDSREKKKKKKRDISTSEILKGDKTKEDNESNSSTSSNDSEKSRIKRNRKKKKLEDPNESNSIKHKFASIFGSDSDDNEDPRLTKFRKLLDPGSRNKAIKPAPKKKRR
jgi:hypothetical protein